MMRSILWMGVLWVLAFSGCEKGSDARSGLPLTEMARKQVWKEVRSVVVIMLENTNVQAALEQPYLKGLLKKGAFLADYKSITHPSQPNYVALTAGNTYGIHNANVSLDVPHLGDLLEEKGKTWKAYAEDFPGDCFLEAVRGDYARRHVPFLSFKNVQDNPTRCKNIVSADHFERDVTNLSLPEFSLYVPNNRSNGHDTGVAYADAWLSRVFNPIFENPKLKSNTLFIVTFDEGSSSDSVYTLFLGAGVEAGVQSKRSYNHYSLLRTLEEIFELSSLNQNDKTATLIDDIWKAPSN